MPWATAASNSAMPSVAMAGHGDHLVARAQDATQRLAPTDERLRQERAAVEMEQVEREERRRPAGLARQPARQLDRVRPAGGIDHDQLAVEDRRPRRDPDGQPGQLGQHRRQVARRPHRRTATVAVPGGVGRPDRHERALAAPPRLEQVLVGVERRRQRAREHRPQVRQIGQPVGLEAQRELVGHRGPMVAR